MVDHIRSLNITQMLTNGAEGYRANGIYDAHAPTSYPFNCWINVGQKGKHLSPLVVLRRLTGLLGSISRVWVSNPSTMLIKWFLRYLSHTAISAPATPLDHLEDF